MVSSDRDKSGVEPTPIVPVTADKASTLEKGAADAPVETSPQLHDDEAYSIFTLWQKRAIILTASFCAFFSPTTGAIYYPALDVIAQDLHVSNSAINLTVTTYLVRDEGASYVSLPVCILTETYRFSKAWPQLLSEGFPMVLAVVLRILYALLSSLLPTLVLVPKTATLL